ncbi:uroporphyrinogen-III C-methyltransferase [Rhodanobacter sp. Si-c]|uniref:Uroporphyrinogen-III C-methyltransferase n=1 Tax=Rhodanobacter lycopersici TaxID=3162487 RepID=A0ABV3QIP0_9GAMM
MNEHEPEPSATPAATPRATKPASRDAAPRGGSVALALLLALLALLAAGYVGWRQWQQRQGHATDAQALNALQQRVAALETTLASVSGGHANLAQRLEAADQLDRTLQASQQLQGDRLRQLEGAVGKLSENTLSAHDATLLDQTESLLRMAKERYELFHDAQGAAAAYALAAQTLAAVNDSAFAGLRQGVETERRALLASQPTGQAEALDKLTALRGALPALPLKPLDVPAGASSSTWSRIGRALAGVISVQRDDGSPLAVADARFARELAALDLAQAQAALLAHDPKAWAAALRRADAGLAGQFDDRAESVQQARATLKQLADALPNNTPVQLGATLTELRNLRAVHTLSNIPVSAASTAVPGRAAGAAR